MLDPGDILFNATNSADNVGKSLLVGNVGEPAVFSNHFFRLRVDDCRLLPGFAARWLNWQFERGIFRAMCKRWVNQATVSRQDLLGMTIDVPNLADQRRITAILDRADALRAKRRAALAHLECLTQSIFLDIFSLPEVQGWPTATVQEIADAKKGSIRTGPFGSQLLHSEFVDEGIVVLGIDNAVANEFRWGERRYIDEMKYRVLSRYRVYPGDVLITIMGTCGRCAVVPDGIPLAINTKHLCCITTDPRACLPEFLHASFLWQPVSRSYLERAAKGAIMAGLNMGIIKGMPLVLPPITVQQEFVERVAAVEAAKLTSGASASQLDDLFSSLQARAFSGQL